LALEECSSQEGIRWAIPRVADGGRLPDIGALACREGSPAPFAILEQTFWAAIESWVSAKSIVSMTGVPVRPENLIPDFSEVGPKKARPRHPNDSASNEQITASKCLDGACGSVLYTAPQCGINRFSADLVTQIGTSKLELLQVWL